MENSYGIGVANRYALFLDDESDPLETLSIKEQEKELKKKAKVAEKENKGKNEQPKAKSVANAQKKPIKETTSNKAQENKREDNKPNQRATADGKPDRTFAKFNNENREERNNRRNREDRPYNGPTENRDRDRENRPRRENSENFENRNRDRGERGERREGRAIGNRPGGPRGPKKTFDDRRGKREFDRQSGSDKTAETERPSDADQSWGETEKIETNEAEKKEEQTEVEATPVEEEPKELTLDEWKAQRAGRAKPQYNIRKAGEGEDPSQWKKMFELKKKEKEEESEDEEYDVSEYPQRVGRQKHVLDIDIQFNDSRRPGGGRGRGQRSGVRGGRGGISRGGGTPRDGRGDGLERPRFREEQSDEKGTPRAPKVDDERDFPSLG
ncbi:SERPINE1 mRNA-binding protein 1-like isoform X3 [Cylas formicarius]|uniref:SERPINE1 mRNA-binding protein 1-like isoform X3 n=1 Tax=Cylas formicarius TaxID=197179 RepID=UPI0029587AED|nr:SERPINE1 mRNA-binding protein 1-like isoform X3 [Cylas formicarius]